MVAVRIAFDAALPAFLSRETPVQGKTFAADAELPWKDLGMSEADLLTFWRAGLVYFRAPVSTTPPLPAPSPASGAEAAAGPKRRARS